MEKKSVKINFNRVDQYIKDKAVFGWQVVSKEDLKNQKILLTLQREPKSVDDIKTTKKLEKQYDLLNRRVPLFSIILAIIGGIALALYFVLKPYVIFYISFLYESLTCFCVAFFGIVIFLLLKIKRKTLVKYILDEAAMRSGASRDYPNKHNIKEETETTWALTNTFNAK